MSVLETERLTIRRLEHRDAEFIVGLLNQPSFIRYIGDKGVRTVEDAKRYLENGPIDSYRRYGFGLYMTELRVDGTAIGMCGLVKRDELEFPDLGFAFLPQYWANGYAFESAAAVLEYGQQALGMRRVLAITSTDNESSMKLLAKLGLTFDEVIDLSGDGDDVNLFSIDFEPGTE